MKRQLISQKGKAAAKSGLRYVICLVMVLLMTMNAEAQRQQMTLGRGVVAVYNGSGVTVTWRRLAQEPEDVKYNVYVNGKLVNSAALSNTNTTLSTANCPTGASVTVTSVVDGVESAQSTPFTYRQISLSGTVVNCAYQTVNYTEAGSPLANDGTFVTKYCWPVDLDGDGEMDYVVNRAYTLKDQNGFEGWGTDKCGGDCLEAYSSEGEHLWTVNLGTMFFACGGQNDGVSVGDFDGDGRGEVIVQVCEGARFWDSSNKTFGKYLYYNGTQQKSNGSGTQTVTSDGTSADIDGDGTTNYTYYSNGKNPQWYFAVIDGLTGAQKAVCAMTLPSDGDMTYTRANKSAFMNDEYSYLSPAMGAAYLDGVHQSAVGQFQCRTTDGNHHYFTYAYGYKDGVFQELWRFKFHEHAGLSEFHHIRIGDVDGDGRDEVMNGQCAVNHDGTLLWTSGIAHGDRFRLSDIDPDRPGQEIFAIQQNAGDMLGMILYDASDGSAIKKWYLSAVGDVGRGECMDVDASHKGYEIWSTMDGIYDCKGDRIGDTKPYPTEGIWWDGALDREALITSGSGNNCPAIVAKYSDGNWSRLYEISKNCSWQLVAENAVRPMFWGDIKGDWREELILKTQSGGVEVGFTCLSTGEITSSSNIYCLLQDPNYFGQITNRGYYQSPNTSFYLGYQMPRPQLPPFMKEDSESQVFGLTEGNATIAPDASKQTIYVMPVKDQTLTIGSALTMDKTQRTALWKSQPGTLALTAPVTTGTLYISEGTMTSNSTIDAAVQLRARGTLAGTPVLSDTIVFESALNYAGCRLQPEGTMTFAKNLTLAGTVYLEMDVPSTDLIVVKGDVKASGTPIFNIKHTSKLEPGEYKLLEYGGTLTGFSKFSVDGLTGLKYELTEHDNAIWLSIMGQREAGSGVFWKGTESATWDYQTTNWQLDGEPTEFVANDSVTFDETASKFAVTMDELFPVGKVNVEGSKAYTFSGDGGFSGEAQLIKNGTGALTLNTTKSDFTGGVTIQGGTVTVKDMADSGIASCLGSAGTIKIGKAKLIINNSNTGTDRSIVLTDTATIQQTSGTAALKGVVSGAGTLQKTGSGQLNINGNANSWAATILAAGTIAQGAWDAKIGATGSKISVTGNSTITIFNNNSSSAVPNLSNTIDVAKGKTLTVNGGKRCKVSGTLTGEGTYAINFPYVRGDVYTNCSNFEGTYEVTSGQLRLRQAIDLSKATLKLDAGVYAAGYSSDSGEGNYTHKIGSLTSTASDCSLNTGTWNVGYLGKDDTFAGVVATSGTLNKYGEGTLTLTGASAAAMTVNAGTLVLNNTSAETTTGTVTVKSGGTACGTGKTASISVQKGGMLHGGKATGSTVGTLSLTGNLTVANGGIIAARTRVSSSGKCTCDVLNASGNIKLTSPTITITNAYGDYADGQEFTLFTCDGTFTLSGTPTIEPAQPATGLLWNTTKLASDGVLGVVADPDYDGIGDVRLYNRTPRAYNLRGQKVDTFNQHGVYIINGKKVMTR